MTQWDKFFEDKIREIAKEKVVLDVGGGPRFYKSLKKFEHLFGDCEYKTMDSASVYNPDIVGDIHDIPLDDETVDAIICKAVLEHVYHPHKAVDEMHRILKKGGKGFFYVPFLYADHSNPIYKDYFRYTRDGIEYLFRNFKTLEICYVRGNVETLLYLTPFRKFGVLTTLCRWADKYFSNRQVSGYNIFVIK